MSTERARAHKRWIGACAATLVALLAGCGDSGNAGGRYGGGAGYGGTGSATPPSLVDVDANGTLTVSPGQGVGVFIQYQTGGHWQVSWTCDTAQSTLSCNFQVDISSATSPIESAQPQSFASSDTFTQVSGQEIDSTTTTAISTQGVTFDTAPGDEITVDAQIDGQRSGTILFFDQNGQVNGGYAGSVADPLILRPSSNP
ncbi:MAG: hypothetical protein ACREJ3_14385 [Polyangiaceae bacterium]